MKFRPLIIVFVALCISLLSACSEASVATTPQVLTYDQIRNTGLANKCPQLDDTSRGVIPVSSGQSFSISELCLEPTAFLVKQEGVSKRKQAVFVPTKLLTRYTSSLDEVSGDLTINGDRSVTFTEKDGIDFQPTTVQLPGGERVPFLFTVKGLVASSQPGLDNISTSTDFEGTYRVPSYRTSNFLDPKGRGLATGYDNAVALPAQADSETFENVKKFDVGEGKISLQVAKVNNATGEIAGTFESNQPSDTDMGGKAPLEVKIRGLFYAKVKSAA
ncbi:MAG: Photosystem II manganese-stabilizing polypeptide [Cyanobacteria bacterium WB6_1B_304]|jgi:photosystem II oxygen-evolving enhancer protein 1|nr:Photosystem II manganese-stabilizing polypeptide [Cyanobacteria bacterium WB6_1B_304]